MKTKLGMLAAVALVAGMVSCGDETTQVIGTRTVADLDKSEVCTIGDMVVNLADNTVYVCDGDRRWTTMKGDAGEKGEAGAKGEQGIPGVKGENGSSCTARIIAEGVEFSCGGAVLDTLTNGQDGAQGLPGVKGENGSSCTATSVANGVEIYCGDQLVATIVNGEDGNDGASCALSSINVNGVDGVEITCGAQKDTVMNGAQGIQGIQGAQGETGSAGASCSGVSLGDTAVVISCGGVVVDTLTNGHDGAQGPQGIQGVQGEAGQSCSGLVIDGVGIEISCGGVVVDTLRNGTDGADGTSCTLASIEVDGVHGVEITCGAQKDTVMNGAQGIQGIQGAQGEPGSAGASCSGVSLGDTAVVISCGGVVVDTLTNGHDGAQGPQGIQGVQGEVGQSCTGRGLGILGIEITCGDAVIDTLRNGTDGGQGQQGEPGVSCSGRAIEGVGIEITCGNVVVDTLRNGAPGGQGEAGTSCTGRTIEGIGVEISCGGVVVDTLLSGNFCGVVAYNAQTHFCDERDSSIYKKVTINGQTWMAENLNYEYEIDGVAYGNWCYNDSAEYCARYGRLYSWAAAMDTAITGCGYGVDCASAGNARGACPEGWHLPNYDEMWALFSFAGDTLVDDPYGYEPPYHDVNHPKAARALLATYGWCNDRAMPSGICVGAERGGTDVYGFSAFPSGGRNIDGAFMDAGDDYASYWTSSDNHDLNQAYHLGMSMFRGGPGGMHKGVGFAVRCIKD